MKHWLTFAALSFSACASQRVPPPSAPARAPVTAGAHGCVAPASLLLPKKAKIRELKGHEHLEEKLGSRTLRFGAGKYRLPGEDASWNRMYGYGPVFWIKDGKRQRTLDLRADFSTSSAVKDFADPASGRVVVFLENGVEGPGHEYNVFISLDRGDSWFRGADLSRIWGSNSTASLQAFFIGRDGSGFAVLKDDAEGAKAFYRVSTNDCGHTWNPDPEVIDSLQRASEHR